MNTRLPLRFRGSLSAVRILPSEATAAADDLDLQGLAPAAGRLEVTAKTGGRYLIRPPAW